MNYEFTFISLVVLFLGLLMVSIPSGFYVVAVVVVSFIFILLVVLGVGAYAGYIRKEGKKFKLKEVGLEWIVLLFLPIIFILIILYFDVGKLMISSFLFIIGMLGVLVGVAKPEKRT